jgi:thiamine-phosphate pyrophosphorylase
VIPVLHIVTDDEILRRGTFLPTAIQVMESGGPDLAFHLRGPGIPGRTLHDLAKDLVAPAAANRVTYLVNDRVDLAMALGMSGAHLGQRSLPPQVARGILGSKKILGLSVHSSAEAEAPDPTALDFLLVGTIFSSPSHPDGRMGGLDRIREVGAVTSLPLLAIGGVTSIRVPELLIAGAHGVAVRGGIWDDRDPSAATRGYLRVLEKESNQ